MIKGSAHLREVDKSHVTQCGLGMVGDADGGGAVCPDLDPFMVLGVKKVGGDVTHGFWVK
jgi:hypothetical protein